MGSVTRLRGRARAGRPLRFPSGTSRAPWRPHSVVRETSSSRDRPPRGAGDGKQQLRPSVPLAERLAALAAAAYRPRGLRGPLPEGELISETASRLDAFSGYPFRAWLAGRAVGRQPGDRQACLPPALLVLGVDLLTCAHGRIGRTVSRRSEPSSRTALNGEQPYPWDRLQPQDAMSRHQVPNLAVDVDSWARSACYPRSTFYPLK